MVDRNDVPLRFPDGTPLPRGAGYNMADVAQAAQRPWDWGPWRLDPSHRALKANDDERHEYEISLGECLTAAQALDWIAQIKNKTWADNATVAGLVRALDDILRLQGNLCPGGRSHAPLTPEKVGELVHDAVDRRAEGMRVYPELDPRHQQ